MDVAANPDDIHVRTAAHHEYEVGFSPDGNQDVSFATNEEDDAGVVIEEDEDVKPGIPRDYHLWVIRETDAMLRKLRKMKTLGHQTRARNFRMIAYKAVAKMLSDQFKEKFTPEMVKNRWRLLRSRWNRAQLDANTPLAMPPSPYESPRRPFTAAFLLQNYFHHMEQLLEEPYACRRQWVREGYTGEWNAPKPWKRQTASRHHRRGRYQARTRDDAGTSDRASEMTETIE